MPRAFHFPCRLDVAFRRDRFGDPEVEVYRRSAICGRLAEWTYLTVTWGKWGVWELTRDGLGFGRLWIDWSF